MKATLSEVYYGIRTMAVDACSWRREIADGMRRTSHPTCDEGTGSDADSPEASEQRVAPGVCEIPVSALELGHRIPRRGLGGVYHVPAEASRSRVPRGRMDWSIRRVLLRRQSTTLDARF